MSDVLNCQNRKRAAALLTFALCATCFGCRTRQELKNCNLSKAEFYPLTSVSVRNLPCGPDEYDFGYKQTTWGEWPGQGLAVQQPAIELGVGEELMLFNPDLPLPHTTVPPPVFPGAKTGTESSAVTPQPEHLQLDGDEVQTIAADIAPTSFSEKVGQLRQEVPQPPRQLADSIQSATPQPRWRGKATGLRAGTFRATQRFVALPSGQR